MKDACKHKIKYETYFCAKLALSGMHIDRQNSGYKRRKLKPYRCGNCGGYHLGSQIDRKRQIYDPEQRRKERKYRRGNLARYEEFA